MMSLKLMRLKVTSETTTEGHAIISAYCSVNYLGVLKLAIAMLILILVLKIKVAYLENVNFRH